MGAGASTSEEADLEIIKAMKAKYEEVKGQDERQAFEAVKKVYLDLNDSEAGGASAPAAGAADTTDAAPVGDAAASAS